MWRETARSVLEGSNASVAMWAVGEKAPTVSTSEAEERDIRAAIMESCWWIASLDDLVTSALNGADLAAYRQAQRQHQHGRVVPGIRWARHRHSHQLAAATVREGRLIPLVKGGSGRPFDISLSWRWHTITEMNLSERDLKYSSRLQPAYEEHVAGYPVRETLYDALRWFNGFRD